MKKVIVTGATGFLGKRITEELIERGDEVTIFTRSIKSARQKISDAYDYVEWNPGLNNWYWKLEDKDAVVHLAGENVMAKRWNEEHKKNILSSRIDGTRSLVNAIGKLKNKPEVFISASAIGYYGNSESPVNEDSEHGKDFLAEVVNAWEKEAGKVEAFGVRRVSIRTGIVLDTNEGALVPMINQFKFFRMNEFCKTLGRIIQRPSLFKVPAFVIKVLFGEAAEVLLNGAQVIPKKIIEAGYKFKFETAEEALKNLLHK